MCVGWVRFGKCFGHEGGNLLNRITALMKEIPGGSLASSTQAVNQARAPIRMRTCAGALILELLASRTVRN